MIAGAINARYEVIVPIEVSGPAGQSRVVDAILDTGFNGILTLPAAICRTGSFLPVQRKIAGKEGRQG